MTAESAARLKFLFRVEHFANVAHDALHRQHGRIMKRAIRQERVPPEDGYLFALALADLLKATAVAQERLKRPDLEQAIDDFERTVPRAKDFRNVLEHWDAYGEGQGRKKDLGSEAWFWWSSIWPPVLRVGGSRQGLDLDLTKARESGTVLYGALCAALRAAQEG